MSESSMNISTSTGTDGGGADGSEPITMTRVPEQPTTIKAIADELGLERRAAAFACFEGTVAFGHVTDDVSPLDSDDAAAVRAFLTTRTDLPPAEGQPDAEQPEQPGKGFEAGYAQSDERIYRKRLHVDADGTATVTFRGTLADATRCWVGRGEERGAITLYGEVEPTETTATMVKVAVVPTGKRTPLGGLRLGQVGNRHVFLLEVDGSVDRAAYEDERTAARAAREAQRTLDATYGGF